MRLAAFLLVAGLALCQTVQIPISGSPTPMHFAGTWSAGTTYNIQDLALYGGSAYVSAVAWNRGNVPSGTSIYWTQIGGGGGAAAWGGITGTLSLQTDLAAALAGKQAAISGAPGSWPGTFAPSAHTHTAADVIGGTFSISLIPTGTTSTTVALGNHTHAAVYEPVLGNPAADGYILQSSAAGVRSWGAVITWATLSGKPSTFAPAAHASTHGNAGSDPVSLDAAQVASGTLADGRLSGNVPLKNGTNAYTGYQDLSSGNWRPPEVVFASLPAASAVTGRVFLVTDAAAAGNCAAGGGSARTFCRSTGSTYEALGSGGGGSSTYYTVSFDGMGTSLTGAATKCIPVKASGSLQSVRLQACNGYGTTPTVCNAGGSATFDILTVANATFNSSGPSAAASIHGTGSLLSISSAYAADGSLTNWNTGSFGGQTVCVAMSSPTAISAEVTMEVK